ncbi:hypothetical protein ACTA71_008655 [Dictyostelium dimigraforme]
MKYPPKRLIRALDLISKFRFSFIHIPGEKNYISIRRSTCNKLFRSFSCVECQKNRAEQEKHGLLNPLPIPARPWNDIKMDFLNLPTTESGMDQVLVIVDRLSKMVKIILCKKTVTSAEVAEIFWKKIRMWSSGMIAAFQAVEPGSIPGIRNIFATGNKTRTSEIKSDPYNHLEEQMQRNQIKRENNYKHNQQTVIYQNPKMVD